MTNYQTTNVGKSDNNRRNENSNQRTLEFHKSICNVDEWNGKIIQKLSN